MNKRDEYIAGLRELADALETNAEIRLPLTGCVPSYGLHFSPENRDGMSAFARLIESPTEGWHDQSKTYWRINGRFAGLHVFAMAAASKLGGRPVTRSVEVFEIEPLLVEKVTA